MNTDPRECNIKVFSRFRPQSGAEVRAGGQSVVSIPSPETCVHAVSCSAVLTLTIVNANLALLFELCFIQSVFDIFYCCFIHFRDERLRLIAFSNQLPHKNEFTLRQHRSLFKVSCVIF